MQDHYLSVKHMKSREDYSNEVYIWIANPEILMEAYFNEQVRLEP